MTLTLKTTPAINVASEFRKFTSSCLCGKLIEALKKLRALLVVEGGHVGKEKWTLWSHNIPLPLRTSSKVKIRRELCMENPKVRKQTTRTERIEPYQAADHWNNKPVKRNVLRSIEKAVNFRRPDKLVVLVQKKCQGKYRTKTTWPNWCYFKSEH